MSKASEEKAGPAQTRGGTMGRAFGRIVGGLCLAVFVTTAGSGTPLGPYRIKDVRSDKHYEVRRLDAYSFVYLDRDYVFAEVPDCLKGKPYVVTANSDKFKGGNAFLTIHS